MDDASDHELTHGESAAASDHEQTHGESAAGKSLSASDHESALDDFDHEVVDGDEKEHEMTSSVGVWQHCHSSAILFHTF